MSLSTLQAELASAKTEYEAKELRSETYFLKKTLKNAAYKH